MATDKHHFLAGKKIIVAGGGIAGLSFAVALGKLWPQTEKRPEVIVYERDTRETGFNREGYSLSLHGTDKNSGLVTLQQLGLLKEILDCAILGLGATGSFKMWDSGWNELIRIKQTPYGDLPTSGIRAARKDLRRILITAAEKAGVTIRWGASCTAARRLEDGQIAATVSGLGDDATEQTCDLLIAADGNRSKIRQSFRPDDGLHFAGANQFGGNARFADGIPKPLDDGWGLLFSGQGVSCFFSPNDKHTVVWALSTRSPEHEGLDPKLSPDEQLQAIVKEAKEVGHMFAEPFNTIVDATQPGDVFVFPARDKEPFYHDAALRGVVFIGDANHAVSPFAGNGANMALKDGLDLAESLCQSESLDQAVAAYDKSSVPRAQETLKTSHQRIDSCHYTGIKATLFRVMLAMARFFMWLTGK